MFGDIKVVFIIWLPVSCEEKRMHSVTTVAIKLSKRIIIPVKFGSSQSNISHPGQISQSNSAHPSQIRLIPVKFGSSQSNAARPSQTNFIPVNLSRHSQHNNDFLVSSIDAVNL